MKPLSTESRAYPPLAVREVMAAIAWSATAFLGLGTLTAVWRNPLFTRMIPVLWTDFAILGVEALLLGAYLGLRTPPCSIKGASLGGILGFLGFGCPICNKILLVLFGSGALLTYFEPVRVWVGIAGIVVLLWALRRKWLLRRMMSEPIAELKSS